MVMGSVNRPKRHSQIRESRYSVLVRLNGRFDSQQPLNFAREVELSRTFFSSSSGRDWGGPSPLPRRSWSPSLPTSNKIIKRKSTRYRLFSSPGDPISMANAMLPSITPLAQPSPPFWLRTSSFDSLHLRRIFDLFDRNGDGEITVEEICQALDRLGLGANPIDLASAVAAYIHHDAAGLAFNDFQALHRGLGDTLFSGPPSAVANEATKEEDMREAFNVFDENGYGFISAKELQAVLDKLSLADDQSIDQVRQMICFVNRDSNGRKDFTESKHMMRTSTVQSN